MTNSITDKVLFDKLERLEEQVLTWSVYNTYVADKNNFDVTAILEMLFTIDKNIDIVKQNLVDQGDLPVLERVVAKWQKTKQDAMDQARVDALILPSSAKRH